MRKDADKLLLSRRNFLKTAGAGIVGAAVLGKFPSFTYDEAMAAAAKEGETAIPTFCAMCGPAANCGIYAFVKDGRFTKVAGMKESPVNAGAVCPKGHGAPQWVYSSERLKYPLKRVGAKGEGKFQQITWDEAIGIVANTLLEQKKKYGPETLGMLSPARRTYSEYLYRFLIAHGSPNYGHSGICAMQMGFTFHYTVGRLAEGRRLCQQRPDHRLGKTADLFGSGPGRRQGLCQRKGSGGKNHLHKAHRGAGRGPGR